jgi:glycosyltransferase involved in cell wall biosynthesis
VRAEFAAREDCGLVFSAGRMTVEKDQATLLRAFSMAAQRRPDAILILAGDGPLRAQLEQEARDLGIAQRVRLPGIRQDVTRLMAAADVFALSSSTEGLPMAVLEAMSAGVPVVSTSVGGLKTLLTDGVTGLLVPPEDSRALAAALVRLLENPVERQRIGAAGKQLVTEEYTVERMCGRYESLFQRLLEAH